MPNFKIKHRLCLNTCQPHNLIFCCKIHNLVHILDIKPKVQNMICKENTFIMLVNALCCKQIKPWTKCLIKYLNDN